MSNAVMAIDTRGMTEQEWLEERTRGIGGSDASAVLGFSRWRTPFEVYLEKTGQVVPQSNDNEATYFGKILEDVVAKEFSRRTGKKVRKRNALFTHHEYPFLIANVDRLVVGERAILECKITSPYNAKEWEGGEIPEEYLVQVQHYLGVLGLEKGYIAVLIGNQKFVWKEIERDDELINMIFQEELNFWKNHVEKGIPPALDGSSAAERFLRERYKDADEQKTVVLKESFQEKIDRWRELKDMIRELDTEKTKIENEIKHELKDAAFGLVGHYRAEWKQIFSNRVDTKKLKDEFPDVYEKVLKKSSSRRFGISEIS